MLPLIVGWLLGIVSAVIIEPLRNTIFGPKLKLEFGDGTEFRARTPEEATYREVTNIHSVHEAEYVRIKVTNTKPAVAKGCRAYLVAVEKMHEDGEFKSTVYCDSIPLPWSCRDDEAYAAVDLPRGVRQFIDVVSTRNQKNVATVFKPAIKTVPYRYMDLFREQGKFRFTIQVSGENVKPVSIRIVFCWHGVWDQYTAEQG